MVWAPVVRVFGVANRVARIQLGVAVAPPSSATEYKQGISLIIWRSCLEKNSPLGTQTENTIQRICRFFVKAGSPTTRSERLAILGAVFNRKVNKRIVKTLDFKS
ncbi:hypothetical protein NQZ68_004752 [Dissostichus eleginoides]|nr:hypothetical protein NQZ68_004752 [Dissostichus eleginoides]